MSEFQGNNKIGVIICGLVRDPGRLRSKLDQFKKWQAEGYIESIVFSTWIGEVDRYNGLRRDLGKAGVVLIEIEEPRLVLKGGHQLHQMLAFHYGLCFLNNDQFVLKTRVDLADNNLAMLIDFLNKTDQTDDFLNIGLKNRILVEYAQVFYPFLCGDAQFFGRKSDLEKLVNMSAEMELVFNRLAVEQTFFFNPFKNIDIFRNHFYWNLPHISEVSHKKNEQINYLSQNESMMVPIRLWWRILNSYFKIGWGESVNVNSEIEDIIDIAKINIGSKLIGSDGSDIIINQGFIKKLITINDKDHITGMDYSQLEKILGPLQVNQNIFQVYEKFRNKFSDLPSPKAVVKGQKKIIIRGAAQHFFVKQENDEASRRYHEQITALRRENHELKNLLNISSSNTALHNYLSRFMSRRLIERIKYRAPFIAKLYFKYLMRKWN